MNGGLLTKVLLIGLVSLAVGSCDPAQNPSSDTTLPSTPTIAPSVRPAGPTLIRETPTRSPSPANGHFADPVGVFSISVPSRLLKKGVSVKLPCRWSQEHDDVRL